MLTKDELKFFVRNGYIVKKGILDKDLCKRAVDIAWENMDEMNIPRDPSQWRKDSWVKKNRGVVKLRGDVCFNEDLIELVPMNAEIRSITKQLIGDGYVSTSVKGVCPTNVRGVYPTIPIPKHLSFTLEPHVEHHALSLFFVAYLDKVELGGGAFQVWPGSHLDFYGAFSNKLDFTPTEEFKRQYDYYNRFEPVEIAGDAGDTIILHHRMLHSGSNNNKDNIRFAILADYLVSNYKELLEQPPGEDVWEDWTPEVRNTVAELEAANAMKADAMNESLGRILEIRSVNLVRKLLGKKTGSQYDRVGNYGKGKGSGTKKDEVAA